MSKKKGLEEQIKSGELSPDKAIAKVKKSKTPSHYFLNWADSVGRKRYTKALAEKES
jgi:hypothetical protein